MFETSRYSVLKSLENYTRKAISISVEMGRKTADTGVLISP